MFRFVLMVGLIVQTFLPLYLIGRLPPPSESHEANFDRLCQAVGVSYPYFREKGIDWDALVDAYRPRLDDLVDHDGYVELVSELLARLEDGHSGVLIPPPSAGRTHFGTARIVDDGVVVDRVGPTGAAAGLVRGAVLTAVGGRPVEEALHALPAGLRSGSTPGQRRAAAAVHVLSTTGPRMTVSFVLPDGEARTVVLAVPDPLPTVERVDALDPTGPAIHGELLPSGFGLIRIPTLSAGPGRDLVAEFDAALDALFGAPGLIIDLRGNGGGDSRIGDRIAGRLIDRPFVYGEERFRLPLPERGWIKRYPYRIRPRGRTYRGPVVLLIDVGSFSSTEMLIASLADAGRAVTVGRRTGGGSGNPVRFRLPGGGVARFSTGAFRRTDGTLIEGVGIVPDRPVRFTVEDLRMGRDPDRVAAEEILCEALARDAAPDPSGR